MLHFSNRFGDSIELASRFSKLYLFLLQALIKSFGHAKCLSIVSINSLKMQVLFFKASLRQFFCPIRSFTQDLFIGEVILLWHTESNIEIFYFSEFPISKSRIKSKV